VLLAAVAAPTLIVCSQLKSADSTPSGSSEETAPISGEIAAPSKDAKAQPAVDTTEDKMIPVKNPLYNAKKPLLFDSGYAEDNSSCMVCHIDFQEEPISSVHEENEITCMACHGDSVTHSGDEFNITRPDVIWGRAEIAAFCRQCHKKHKKPDAVKEFRDEWLSKRRPNGRVVLEDSVCTDCHGKHAIVGEEGDFR